MDNNLVNDAINKVNKSCSLQKQFATERLQRDFYQVSIELLRCDYDLDTPGLARCNKVDYENIFGKSRHVMVAAGVGEGKTRTLQEFGQDVVDKLIPQFKDIKLVICLKYHSDRLGDQRDVVIYDVILGGKVCPNLAADEKQSIIKWLNTGNNDKHVLFLIDNVHLLKLHIKSEHAKDPQLGDSSDEQSLIECILNPEYFLPNCKILSSILPSQIKYLPKYCMPDRFLLLGKFDKSGVESLFLERIDHFLKQPTFGLCDSECFNNPRFILSLCRAVKEQTLGDTKWPTMTDLTVRSLRHFLGECHSLLGLTSDSFYKLCMLAHTSCLDGKYEFSDLDLSSLPPTVLDMLFLDPFKLQKFCKRQSSGKTCSSLLKYSFVDKHLQMLLGAYHAINEDIEDFKLSVKANVACTKFIYGLLFHERHFKYVGSVKQSLHNKSVLFQKDIKKKRSRINKDEVARAYKGMVTSNDGTLNVNLQRTDYHNPITITNVEKVEMKNIALTSSNTGHESANSLEEETTPNYQHEDEDDVVSFMDEKRSLVIDLWQKSLTDGKLQQFQLLALHECGSEEVEKVNDRLNEILITNSTSTVLYCLGKLLSKLLMINKIKLSGSQLRKYHLMAGVSGLNGDNAFVSEMDVSCNRDVCGEMLAQFICKSQANKLNLTKCNVNESSFQSFMLELEKNKHRIEEMIIAENPLLENTYTYPQALQQLLRECKKTAILPSQTMRDLFVYYNGIETSNLKKIKPKSKKAPIPTANNGIPEVSSDGNPEAQTQPKTSNSSNLPSVPSTSGANRRAPIPTANNGISQISSDGNPEAQTRPKTLHSPNLPSVTSTSRATRRDIPTTTSESSSSSNSDSSSASHSRQHDMHRVDIHGDVDSKYLFASVNQVNNYNKAYSGDDESSGKKRKRQGQDRGGKQAFQDDPPSSAASKPRKRKPSKKHQKHRPVGHSTGIRDVGGGGDVYADVGKVNKKEDKGNHFNLHPGGGMSQDNVSIVALVIALMVFALTLVAIR